MIKQSRHDRVLARAKAIASTRLTADEVSKGFIAFSKALGSASAENRQQMSLKAFSNDIEEGKPEGLEMKPKIIEIRSPTTHKVGDMVFDLNSNTLLGVALENVKAGEPVRIQIGGLVSGDLAVVMDSHQIEGITSSYNHDNYAYTGNGDPVTPSPMGIKLIKLEGEKESRKKVPETEQVIERALDLD